MQLDLIAKLSRAARFGCLEDAQLLCQEFNSAGLPLDVRDQDGASPLYVAAAWGHPPIVQLLLEANASVEFTSTQWQATPLYVASQEGNLGVVTLLIKAKADQRPSSTQTPLSAASRRGHIRVVRALLLAGANPDFARGGAMTPTLLAVAHGKVEIVRLLLVAKAALQSDSLTMNSPLCMASGQGQLEVVKLLLDAKADVCAPSAYYPGSALGAACFKGHGEVAELLLRAKAGLDSHASEGTPLFWACSSGHLALAHRLLHLGADPALSHDDGTTPEQAARLQGHERTAQLLHEAGREWSRTFSSLWPPSFRRSALAVLLVAQRLQCWPTTRARPNAIPIELWVLCLSFCSRRWFEP